MDKLWLVSDGNRKFLLPSGHVVVDEMGGVLMGAREFEIFIDDETEFQALIERVDQVILVAGQTLFPSAVSGIPKHLPRIVFSSHESPQSVRDQLDALGVDAQFFFPTSIDVIKSAIQKCYEDKMALNSLREELEKFSDIAFTAMTSASEMGVVAFFAQAVQHNLDFEALANQTLQCLKDFGVQGVVQFYFDDSHYVYPASISDTYRNLLELTHKSKSRVVSQGRFLIFNFQNVQILVTDAPHMNDEKYGRLRDVLTQVCSIAASRAKTIKVNALLKEQQKNSQRVMMLLEMASRDNRMSVKTIMMDLSMSLREMAVGLDLTLDQETALLRLSEKAMESLECLHEASDMLEVHFRGLLGQISKAAKLLEHQENDISSGDLGSPGSSVELF